MLLQNTLQNQGDRLYHHSYLGPQQRQGQFGPPWISPLVAATLWTEHTRLPLSLEARMVECCRLQFLPLLPHHNRDEAQLKRICRHHSNRDDGRYLSLPKMTMSRTLRLIRLV